jgi:hypothetical protein
MIMSILHVGPVIILSHHNYEDWKRSYNRSLTRKGHLMVQSCPTYLGLKSEQAVANRYTQWTM